jgi:hypothetical protein
VSLPDLTPGELSIGRQMRGAVRKRPWYTGSIETLIAGGVRRMVPSSSEPELKISLLLSKDRMHHSVGWWRNADYECCLHLSMAAFPLGVDPLPGANVELPSEDVRRWGHAIFGEWVRWVWHEPGGTDPRLTPEEKRTRRHMVHLRLFIHHEPPHQPIYPEGEVYHLTRWVPGLTPEKVDR